MKATCKLVAKKIREFFEYGCFKEQSLAARRPVKSKERLLSKREGRKMKPYL